MVVALPNEFVGPEERLEGLANASWGSVAILLRNGEPQRLVTPGSRFGRGWRAPFIGTLTFVQVNTDSAPFGMSVTGVPTRDGYHVGLDFDARVKLNPSDDFRHLKSFIERSGRGFADDLIAEVQRGLEQLAYSVIATFDHQMLRERSLSNAFAQVGLPFAVDSGLLMVTSLNVGNVAWDAKAIELENVSKDQKVKSAAVRAESTLGAERLQVFAEVAAQLGLPPAALAYPEQYALSQQRSHEALLALLRPEMRMVWQRNPGLLDNLFQRAGIPSGSILQPIAPVTYSQLPAGRSEITEILVEPEEDVELNRNLTLRRAWTAHEGEEVLGIEVGGRGRPAPTIIAVTRSGRRPGTETIDALTRVAGGGAVRLLVLRYGDWNDLVAQWFHQVEPQFAHLRVSIEREGEDLRVRVHGPALEAHAAVERLTAPGETPLEALEELTPFVRIDVELGEE